MNALVCLYWLRTRVHFCSRPQRQVGTGAAEVQASIRDMLKDQVGSGDGQDGSDNADAAGAAVMQDGMLEVPWNGPRTHLAYMT